MNPAYIDLVTVGGEIIRIEIPIEHEDAARDEIEATMKRRDWFGLRQWDGAKATYMGHSLDRVNMGMVVGQL
jgi:hypothetical protein